MPKSKQIVWSQLRVGLLVIVALIIFAVLVFLMSGEGFFQRKYDLKVFTENAAGLRTGDPVRLAGVDVGNVLAIGISGSHDPSRAVRVDVRLLRKYHDEIRDDSVATLAAEGLLGQRYLNITRGSPSAAEVPPGGEVKMKETAEISDVVASSADVLTNLNRIVRRVDNIMAQVEAGKGTLGRIIYDESLYKKADKSVDDIQNLIAYASAGKGSFGKLLMTDELYNTALGTLTKADQVVDDVRSGQGAAGKFIYDPALYDKATQLVTRADGVMAGIEKGQGTVGKALKDETLYNRATAAIDAFADLGEKLQRGEGSAAKLLNDPTLYNNLNSFSQELRGLIADFRQNPKKFLTVHLKIF
jgi:phospholipid/cholesterol/gamma-HCH transport system substrate-binding protein